jgi:putative ABC transport system ATP-binding protein
VHAESAVRCRGLGRTFGEGRAAVRALHGVDLDIEHAELVVLLGPSGSGKTTLLNLIGALDTPTAGKLEVDGIDLSAADPSTREAFRRDHVGFVFQFFNLVPTLTAAENVTLINELTERGGEQEAASALHTVGLDERIDSFPATLSGGEQQRVAIARAVAKDPTLLLCDEPTGSLDLETGKQVLALLQALHDRGRTIIIVTHNSVIGQMANRVVHLRDGTVVGDERAAMPAAAGDLVW